MSSRKHLTSDKINIKKAKKIINEKNCLKMYFLYNFSYMYIDVFFSLFLNYRNSDRNNIKRNVFYLQLFWCHASYTHIHIVIMIFILNIPSYGYLCYNNSTCRNRYGLCRCVFFHNMSYYLSYLNNNSRRTKREKERKKYELRKSFWESLWKYSNAIF